MSICFLGRRPGQNGIVIFRSTTEAVLLGLILEKDDHLLLINGIFPADPGTGALDKDASIPTKSNKFGS
jgi:hypothetical protein